MRQTRHHTHDWRNARRGGNCGRRRGSGRDCRRRAWHMDGLPAPFLGRDDAAPELSTQFPGADVCPLCKNHCPADAPGCPKGEAHFSMQMATERRSHD